MWRKGPAPQAPTTLKNTKVQCGMPSDITFSSLKCQPGVKIDMLHPHLLGCIRHCFRHYVEFSMHHPPQNLLVAVHLLASDIGPLLH